ncbi:MAG: META domain-containing protein [Bacteroidales bacterium]|nr:META domain-containing protein [Bacteroidales bacterium]MDD4830272.1 META domain-containing protein [Bacteroidales bacterium]
MKRQSIFIILTFFLFTSCSTINKKKNQDSSISNKTTNHSISFFQTEWELIKMGSSKPKLTETDNKITILFSKNNSHFAGYSGCNRYSGKFNIKKENLTIENVISTKMACPDLNMSFENNYLNALNKVTNYNIIEDTLFLIKGERPVLIFIAK